MPVAMPSVLCFDGKIFYLNCIRLKIDCHTNGYRLTIKQADIKGSRIKITINHLFGFITCQKKRKILFLVTINLYYNKATIVIHITIRGRQTGVFCHLWQDDAGKDAGEAGQEHAVVGYRHP